jgi:hypothetical protein
MACPSLIIDDKKVILLSGFESEAGKLTAVTAKRELVKAAKQHREAVAFGYVAGKWRPAA